MRVALICTDKPNSLDIRTANRPAHLEHLNGSGIVEMAGPFLNAEGGMNGSLIVLSVNNMAEAEAFAAADPYAKAGLIASVELREWKKVIG